MSSADAFNELPFIAIYILLGIGVVSAVCYLVQAVHAMYRIWTKEIRRR